METRQRSLKEMRSSEEPNGCVSRVRWALVQHNYTGALRLGSPSRVRRSLQLHWGQGALWDRGLGSPRTHHHPVLATLGSQGPSFLVSKWGQGQSLPPQAAVRGHVKPPVHRAPGRCHHHGSGTSAWSRGGAELGVVTSGSQLLKGKNETTRLSEQKKGGLGPP